MKDKSPSDHGVERSLHSTIAAAAAAFNSAVRIQKLIVTSPREVFRRVLIRRPRNACYLGYTETETHHPLVVSVHSEPGFR